MLSRETKELVIRIDDGLQDSSASPTPFSEKQVSVRELTMAETDKYFEIVQEIARKAMEKVNNATPDPIDFHDIFHKTYESGKQIYIENLKLQEPLYKIMTGEIDLQWIYKARERDLIRLEQAFLELNPMIDRQKKTIEMKMNLISQIVKKGKTNILFQALGLSELLTESDKDTE